MVFLSSTVGAAHPAINLAYAQTGLSNAPGSEAHSRLPGDKVDTSLLDEFATRSTADFWVNFEESPDLDEAGTMDWSERGWFVYEQLVQAAADSQAAAIGVLEDMNVSYEPFWIANTIYVRNGDMDLVSALAALPEVTEVMADGVHEVLELEPGTAVEQGSTADPGIAAPGSMADLGIADPGTAAETADGVEWGVADIRAPLVWSVHKTRGEGIVVGSIDSGVQYQHEALVSQYRGNNGDGTFDHNYNWHDPAGRCGGPGSGPCDNTGWGTHAVGIIVGDDGDGNQIGVAPGARWIAAKGCETLTCSEASLLSSMQFMLAPTDLNGENEDPDMRPHIVNNSWRGRPQPNTNMHEAVQAWVAAGIFPVFGGGDTGRNCETILAPAMFPESYAVGNYNANYILLSSSRGPAPDPYGVVKPDITAPGVNIRSSWNNGSYSVQNGSFSAASHVAGVIALLWSGTDIVGDIDGTRLALGETAVTVEDLSCGGEPGFNNAWGRGRVDAFEAFRFAAQGDVGFAVGVITDANDGKPVAGAAVTAVQDESFVRTVRTASDGTYRLWLRPGMYHIEVSALDYTGDWEPITISEDGQEVTTDFTLETALLVPDEQSLTFAVVEGETGGGTFRLKNEGGAPAQFDFSIFAPIRPAAGEGTDGTGMTAGYGSGPADDDDVPGPGPVDPPGKVIKSWDSTLTYIYGIGYDGDVIIGSVLPNDRNNYRFDVDGGFISKWSTQHYGGSSPADMAYDANHGLLWHLTASPDTDRCIYGLNPEEGTVADKICGPEWTKLTQRGLAYRPDNDTFYLGGWTENVIYQIKGLSHRNPGEIIAREPFEHGLSGLAWNGTQGVLWAATNSETDTLYAMVPGDGWREVAVMGHPAGGLYQGGGLSMDENGNLWMVSQGGTVYLVESGMSAVPPAAPWLAADGGAGPVNPDDEIEVDVAVDTAGLEPGLYSGALHIKTNGGRDNWTTIPVTLDVLYSNAGWVEGTITDANDEGPVAGATVNALNGDGEIVQTVKTDEEGEYRFQLYVGEYTVEASAVNYDSASAPVSVKEDGDDHVINLALPTALGGITPGDLQITAVEGATADGVLTLSNSGTAEMNWRTLTYRLKPYGTGSADSGAEDYRTRRHGDFDPLAMTTEGMNFTARAGEIPAARGEVLKSWDTGLVSPWGVGYYGGVIISNPSSGAGDDRDYKFTDDGEFVTKWSTAGWIDDIGWAADMAYDANHHLIWQVAVGGDNCLYGLDPEDGTQTEKICGYPWAGVPQRGVAYNPDDDTLFVGGWVDNIIYHIKGLSHDNPGEQIREIPFEPEGLAGMAWNDSARILWVATNSPDDHIYALSADAGWAEVAVLAHPDEGGHLGAGLSIDDDGNLWMISRRTRKAYLVDSGIPMAGALPWLTVSPGEGVLAADDSASLNVTVDAGSLEPGSYEAFVVVETDSGRVQNLPVEVTVEVTAGVSAYVEGMVTDANDGEAVAGATVEAVKSDGTVARTAVTAPDGTYELRLLLGEYDINVSADDYAAGQTEVKLETEGSRHGADFSLETARGAVDPDTIELTVAAGDTGGTSFTLSNTGGMAMEWAMRAMGRKYPGIGDGGTPGEVIKSWQTGLAVPWGVGFDGDVIISNPVTSGGDNHNYRFTVDGEFISKWPSAIGNWGADMAYDDTHDILWQVAVEGDNCLHGFDPVTGSRKETICSNAWTRLSQRAVAYRPDDDTLYIGGWTQQVVHQIKGLSHDNPGEIIDQHQTGLLVSGLAWNPTAGVLWVATNSADDSIHGLTPDDGWEEIAVLPHPAGLGRSGAGTSMDNAGNLWVTAQANGMAYLIATGIPHIPVDWMTFGARAGTVAPGSADTITIDVDASDLEPGTYEAELQIETNGGRRPNTMSVIITMEVVEPGADPVLTVTEPANGTYTNDDTITVAGTAVDPDGREVTVTINGEEADVADDGSFEMRILLPEDDGPFGITVTAENAAGGYAEETRTVIVDRTAPDIPVGTIRPAEDVELEWGDRLTISFAGESGLAASYQLLIDGTGSGGSKLPGIPMEEVGEGEYAAVYTAPEGMAFTGAEIEIYAMDKAGNITRVTAPGKVTVVGDDPGEPDPDPVNPPSLVITEPEDGFLTNRDAVRVSGIATDDQQGQNIEKVTVNGRTVSLDPDGSFSTRIILWEGDNTITVTATNTAGETAVETVKVTADWTAPELTNMEPAADVTLRQGETYTFRFESEEGLTAAYQIVVGGSRGTWITRDIPVKGTPMTYVGGGVYEAVYTAPAGVLLDGAIVQFNAADPAGNVIMTTAPGAVTVTD